MSFVVEPFKSGSAICLSAAIAPGDQFSEFSRISITRSVCGLVEADEFWVFALVGAVAGLPGGAAEVLPCPVDDAVGEDLVGVFGEAVVFGGVVALAEFPGCPDEIGDGVFVDVVA